MSLKSLQDSSKEIVSDISARVTRNLDELGNIIIALPSEDSSDSLGGGGVGLMDDEGRNTGLDIDLKKVSGENALLVHDINRALQLVHNALEIMEPNKSPEELQEIHFQTEDKSTKVVKELLHKIHGEKDAVISQEMCLQAKVYLYQDWSDDIITHAQSSYPETSQALKELKSAHEILFNQYPGTGSFSGQTKAGSSPPPPTDKYNEREIDAATFLKQNDIKTAKPVLREIALGPSALKRTSEDATAALKLKRFFQTNFPITKWLPNYERQWLQGDIVAGFTSGIFVIPQAMAYSLLIGIPPKNGLFSALVPGILYAILGGCGQVAFGPVAILSLLLNTCLQDFPDASMEDKIGICIFLSLMMGFTLLLMGILKFGFITTFLSQPVLSGFTSAAAVIILINQLKLILGVHITPSSFPVITLYREFAALEHEGFKWGTFLLAVIAIIFNYLCKYVIVNIPKTKIPFPGAMLSVVIGVALIAIWPDLANTIEIVGPIPTGLPTPTFPISLLAYNRFASLVNTFLVMALLAFLEMITVGKLYSSQNGYTVDPNGELVAAGAANVVGSFFMCFPTTGGFGRSPVNASAGAKTQLTALISCVVVAIVLLLLTNVFSILPKAILAAIIFVAVLSLFDKEQAKYLWKVNKSEFALMMITFIVTLGIGPQYGIFISVGLSLLLVLFRSSRPGYAVLGRLPGTAVYRSIVDFPSAICIPGIVLFQFHSPIYFMNATYLKRKLEYTETILSRHTKTSAIIVDAQAITSIDSVGISILREIVKTYKSKGIEIFFSAMAGRAEKALERADLKAEIGEDHFFPRLHDAIRAVLTHEAVLHSARDDATSSTSEKPTGFGEISVNERADPLPTEHFEETTDSSERSSGASSSSSSSKISDEKVVELDNE